MFKNICVFYDLSNDAALKDPNSRVWGESRGSTYERVSRSNSYKCVTADALH